MSQLYAPDLALRSLAVALLIIRTVYWEVTERRDNQKKPLLQKPAATQHLKRIAATTLSVLLLLQLLGLSLAPYPYSFAVQLIGFLAVLTGFAVSMSARRTLGANWAHGAEYQIKHNHELVTAGVYKYIRHPIYAGIFLSFIGAEIVAGSFIVVIFLITLPLTATYQAKHEEAILTKQFGAQYRTYMSKTARFIPGLW